MADMRKATDRVYDKYPKLKGKIKVSFTGMPAHVHTQTETVYSDVGGAGIISILVVAMILGAMPAFASNTAITLTGLMQGDGPDER